MKWRVLPLNMVSEQLSVASPRHWAIQRNWTVQGHWTAQMGPVPTDAILPGAFLPGVLMPQDRRISPGMTLRPVRRVIVMAACVRKAVISGRMIPARMVASIAMPFLITTKPRRHWVGQVRDVRMRAGMCIGMSTGRYFGRRPQTASLKPENDQR